MQNRIGPNRAGPYGVLQTLADGIKLFFKEQSIPIDRRPARVPARAVPVDHAGVPDVLRRPDRRRGVDPRAPHVPPGRRPADRRAVDPRDVGHRRVRRDARGLVVGIEVPAARFGARDRAAALVRSRVRSRDPRRADPGGHAVDACTSSTQQGGTAWRSIFSDWYWLPAIVPFVDLPDRGDSPRRTTRPSTSSRPSRSSSAGSTPSTPASASRSSSSPSS